MNIAEELEQKNNELTRRGDQMHNILLALSVLTEEEVRSGRAREIIESGKAAAAAWLAPV